MFRVAKIAGEWDVDKLEDEMPCYMVVEWNRYLDYELEILTRAIMGTLPAVGGLIGGGQSSMIKLTDPEQIGGLFDALNKGN